MKNKKINQNRINVFAFIISFFVMSLPIWAENIDELRKGVVQIQVFSQGNDVFSPWLAEGMKSSSGTGFIISGNRILTNAHVVSNAKFIQIQRHNQTEWTEAKIVHIAHDCDLAMLTAKDADFFKDSYEFEIGDIPDLNSPVLVMGYPIGGDKISLSRGIVSRKDQSIYSHSDVDSHLVIQVDAAINPGNSGGPAIQDNKVVGVAFQGLTKGENIGYIIPTSVVKYFLEDVKDGKYDGYVELGIRVFNSFNKALRDFKKIPNGKNGVFVTRVLKGGSAEGFLKKDDFLMEIDNHPIGNNGTVSIDKDATVDFIEIVDNKHAGETVKFKLMRNGAVLETSFKLKIMKEFEYMRYQYDKVMDFFLAGGLLFQEHSKDLLNAWSRNGDTVGGSQFLYRFYYFLDDELNKDIDRDVIFYRKLSHPVNSHADYFLNMSLESINGVKIKNLNDLRDFYNKTNAEFLQLKFKDTPFPLILKKQEMIKADSSIKKLYNLEVGKP